MLLSYGLCAFLVLPCLAFAQSSDGLTITLSPQVEFGVAVGTTSEAFTAAAGTPSFTTAPILVEIVGNVQPVELDVSGRIDSTAPWLLASDEIPQTDRLRVYGLFSDDSLSSRPADALFTGSIDRLVTDLPRRAGGSNGAGTAFEHLSLGTDMDGLPVGARRHLWLRLDAPPVSTTARPQTLSVTITAVREGL